MINVLVADDSSLKARDIIKFLEKFPEIDYQICSSVSEAKEHLIKRQYDLFILDLCLPNKFGQVPSPENGLDFLRSIESTKRILKPYHIIGLTAHEEYIQSYTSKFAEYVWILIQYVENSNSWEKQIKSKIDYLIQSKHNLQISISDKYIYDIAIITALRDPELSAVLRIGSWEEYRILNDPTIYFKSTFKQQNYDVNVIAACADQMGMVATTALTIKMIEKFRPKYVAMTGIAGGIRGKGNYGDIIVAESTFDYGSGKVRTDVRGKRKFEPDFRHIDLTPELKQEFLNCKSTRFQLDSIRSEWIGPTPESPINLIVGPLASGAGVIEHNGTVSEVIDHSRKLVGIDMESYGLYYAVTHCSQPRPVGVMSIKSISDFADPHKNDKFQLYSAYTSSKFLYHFVVNKLVFVD